MSLLAATLVRALNHLVTGEPWAGERLRHFAGQHVLIEAGPLHFTLGIDGHGRFAPAADTAVPDVTITLPADTPALLMVDRARVFAGARLAGAADFAETLAFVFRHLHWDVEADLAGLVGDIAARRLVMAGRQFQAWQGDALARGGANLAEYFSEEAGMLVTPRDMRRFNQDMAELRDDLARLEKRVQRLA